MIANWSSSWSAAANEEEIRIASGRKRKAKVRDADNSITIVSPAVEDMYRGEVDCLHSKPKSSGWSRYSILTTLASWLPAREKLVGDQDSGTCEAA